MDSRGHLYASDELAKQIAAEPKHSKRRSFIRSLGTNTSGAMIAIVDAAIAKELAAMPSRKRRVFYGSRKKGHPEAVSIAKARAAQ